MCLTDASYRKIKHELRDLVSTTMMVKTYTMTCNLIGSEMLSLIDSCHFQRNKFIAFVKFDRSVIPFLPTVCNRIIHQYSVNKLRFKTKR